MSAPPVRVLSSTWSHWLVVLLLLTSIVGTIPRVSADSHVPRVNPGLAKKASDNPDETFRLIVQRNNGDTRIDDTIKKSGRKKIKDVAGDAFVVEVQGKDIRDLSEHAAVKYVTIDAPVYPTSTGPVDASKLGMLYAKAVGADQVWATGITGAGVGVAVLDTGISGKADFTRADGTSRIVAQAKFNSNTNSMADGYGHGTHVAGIIAGNSWRQTDTAVQGKYIGIAPRAHIVNVKVSDDQGMSYISDVVNGIEWVIVNRATYNIRVMNLSLVSSLPESYGMSMLSAAAERAWFSGIFVVAAAGNAGPGSMLYAPANDPFVMTVGAADIANTVTAADDSLAPWSSYGVSQDAVVKPDVVAPGRYMAAPMASGGATLSKRFPDRIVDTNYIWLSGTSMAAPVVAGIAALVFEAHPEWTNDQVKWLMSQTATQLGVKAPLTGTFVAYPGQGSGEVNALQAVTYSGIPEGANQGTLISAHLIGPDGTTIYSNSSWSSSSWSSSSWSSSSWSSSSWSSSSWSSSSWSTSGTTGSEWVVVDVE